MPLEPFMRAPRRLLILLCAAALVLAPCPPLFAAGSKAAFEKALKELQQSPEDPALRKKLFHQAQALDELPAPPDDVAILKGKAAYLVKTANSPADYQGAVDAYQKAVRLAPWVPELYYNLGVVQEKAGQASDAAASFKLYLEAAPQAEDRDKVLERLGKLEVQQEQQHESASTSPAKSAAAAPSAAAIKDWEGRRSGEIVVGVLSGVCLVIGAIGLGLGVGDTSDAKYTTSPGYSSGVLYNKAYEGKYWSDASYQQYTQGESELALGAVFGGMGLVGLIITVAMDPGPKPGTALLNVNGNALAWALPPVKLDPAQGRWNAELLHVQF
jgi:tetratricopeptide (TPR) repeat protein